MFQILRRVGNVLRIQCPNSGCGKSYRVDDALAGKSARCKACGETIKIAVAAVATHAEGSAEAGNSSLSSLDPPSPTPHASAKPAEARPQSGILKAATPQPSATEVPKKLGRFEIRSVLGAGAFGTVYRAHDPVLDREVALKVPQATAITDKESAARFLREAKAAAHDRQNHVWNVHTGKIVHRLKGHEGGVKVLAFSADGRRLISGGHLNDVKLWELPQPADK